MRSIILNDEEELVLREELECRLREIELEITHTDRTSFRTMLKHRQVVMQLLLQQLQAPASATAMPLAAKIPGQPTL